MRGAVVALSLLVVASACRRLDDIPEDVDGAAAWLYEHQSDGLPEAVFEALSNLRDGLPLEGLDGSHQGLLASLGPSAVAAVGRQAVEGLPEPEQLAITEEQIEDGTFVRLEDHQGMLIASVIPCTVEDVVGIHIRLDQDEIHGGYDEYERRYVTDFGAFERGERPDLAWSTDYQVTVSLLRSTYHANIQGGIRWVDLPDGARLGLGRAHLPEPGVFTRGTGYFRQDYHLDLFFEVEPGKTAHVFSVWRDLRMGSTHSSNVAFIATTSSRFAQADETIAELCTNGG